MAVRKAPPLTAASLLKLAELPTRDLRGVEILSPGLWNGHLYTEQDCDDMITAFAALKGRYDPVGKLGHDGDQELAQADGYPAIGWVSNLYKVGKKLVGDFVKVPQMVGDLITAGAYNKVSSEIWFDVELDGEHYPRVLKAVAFLGADAPAVKDIRSISDVAQLYKDPLPAVTVHLAERTTARVASLTDFSYEAIRDELQAHLNARFPADSDWRRPWVMETYATTFVFSDIEGRYWRGTYTLNVDNGEITIVEPFTEVNRVVSWADVTASLSAQLVSIRTRTKEIEPMDLKKLAATLGLPETATEAECLAKLTAINAAATASVNLSDEIRSLRDEVGRLTASGAQTSAKALVDDALKAGKIIPAQRPWAEAYALSDAEGFSTYVESSPKLSILSLPTGSGTAGSEAMVVGEEATPGRAESIVAAQLGVTADALENARKGRTGAELTAAAAAARSGAAQ